MVIGIELNVFFTKAAIKPSLSKSLKMHLNSEVFPRSRLLSHQHHVFLPTLSSGDTPALACHVARVLAPTPSGSGLWKVKFDIHPVKFRLVSCDSLFILSNLLDS